MHHLGGLITTFLVLLSAEFVVLTNTEKKLAFQKFRNLMVDYQNRSKDVVFAFNGLGETASFPRIPVIIEFFSNILTVPLVTTRIAVVMSSPSHVIHSNYITYRPKNTSCMLDPSNWRKCYENKVRKNDTSSSVGLKRVSKLLTKSSNNSHRIAILMSDHHNASKVHSFLTEMDRKNRSTVTFTVNHSGNSSDEFDNVAADSNHVFLIRNAVLMKELNQDLYKISAKCSQKTIKHPCKKCLHSSNQTGELRTKWKRCHLRKTREVVTSQKKTCSVGYCLNGGACIDTATGVVCRCTNDFKGEICQTKIANCSSKPCKNGGKCIDHDQGFKCCCGREHAGEFCEREAQMCDKVSCFNGGTCVNKLGSYECKCVDGFSGKRCEINHGIACSHVGKIYPNEARWKEDCKVCLCENSQVTCKPEECHEVSCRDDETQILPKGECCRKCVPESERCLNSEVCTFACRIIGNTYKCSCPPGMRLASNNHSCIDSSHCNDNEKIYAENEVWTTNCKTCQCNRGEITCKKASCPAITCKQNERQLIRPGECCEICAPEPESCSLFHGGDVSTFDGYRYSFQGKCRYVLSHDCVTDKFNIQYVNSPNKLRKRTVFIIIECIEIEISPSGDISIEKEKIRIPYTRSNLVHIIPGPSSQYFSTVMFHIVDFVTVIWKSTGDVVVLVPPNYKGKLCGLCGNFNGNEHDDVFDEHHLPPNSTMDTAYEPVEFCSAPAESTTSHAVPLTMAGHSRTEAYTKSSHFSTSEGSKTLYKDDGLITELSLSGYITGIGGSGFKNRSKNYGDQDYGMTITPIVTEDGYFGGKPFFQTDDIDYETAYPDSVTHKTSDRYTLPDHPDSVTHRTSERYTLTDHPDSVTHRTSERYTLTDHPDSVTHRTSERYTLTDHPDSVTHRTSERYTLTQTRLPKEPMEPTDAPIPDGIFSDKTRDPLEFYNDFFTKTQDPLDYYPDESPESSSRFSLEYSDTSGLSNVTETARKDEFSRGSSTHSFLHTTISPTVGKTINYTSGLRLVTTVQPTDYGSLDSDNTSARVADFNSTENIDPGKKLILKPDKEEGKPLRKESKDPKPGGLNKQFSGCPTGAAATISRSEIVSVCIFSLHLIIGKCFLPFT